MPQGHHPPRWGASPSLRGPSLQALSSVLNVLEAARNLALGDRPPHVQGSLRVSDARLHPRIKIGADPRKRSREIKGCLSPNKTRETLPTCERGGAASVREGTLPPAAACPGPGLFPPRPRHRPGGGAARVTKPPQPATPSRGSAPPAAAVISRKRPLCSTNPDRLE